MADKVLYLKNKHSISGMKKYFPTKPPPYCKTWFDLTEIWVSGILSHEAYLVREHHVSICKQCQAAEHPLHPTEGTEGEKSDSSSVGG